MNYKTLKEILNKMTERQLKKHVVIRTKNGEFHPMHDIEPAPETVYYDIEMEKEFCGKKKLVGTLKKGHPLIVYIRADEQYAGIRQNDWEYGELL